MLREEAEKLVVAVGVEVGHTKLVTLYLRKDAPFAEIFWR